MTTRRSFLIPLLALVALVSGCATNRQAKRSAAIAMVAGAAVMAVGIGLTASELSSEDPDPLPPIGLMMAGVLVVSGGFVVMIKTP